MKYKKQLTSEYEFIDPIPPNGGLFDASALAPGGAICAAKLALQGEPAFAIVCLAKASLIISFLPWPL